MARVQVRLPQPLRPLVGGVRVLELDVGTVGEALRDLADRHPSLRRQLFRIDGRLREAAAVFVNRQGLLPPGLEGTALRDGDVVDIVPAVSGGSGNLPSVTTTPSPAGSPFSLEAIRRYSRHLLLPEVGLEGQRKLQSAKVLVVGAGGLGSPAALYLAAAGVGTLGLVEYDRVDLSNLQRQVLYDTEDVGHPKLERAVERVQALNPGIDVRAHPGPLDSGNALDLLRDYDVVLDGSDNFPTRYLVNDACVLLGKPDVYGSVYRFEGQATVFDARRGPCYRCLFPEPPPPGFVPNCAEGGVLGVLPGLIGEIQATETLKLLLGVGEPLVGRLLLYDALEMRFRELRVHPDEACVVSGSNPTQKALIDYPAFCGSTLAPQASPPGLPHLSAEELAALLRSPEPPLLVDVRQPGEWAIGHLPGALLIPRGELAERVGELSHAREIVVYCSSGNRSALATRLLLDLGLTRVRNLEGGLASWAEKVDPSMPTY